MMPATVLGEKGVEILKVCALPKTDTAARAVAWARLDAKFARKAVWRKVVELQERGYLIAERDWPVSWLTDKGRHALETHPMRG